MSEREDILQKIRFAERDLKEATKIKSKALIQHSKNRIKAYEKELKHLDKNGKIKDE